MVQELERRHCQHWVISKGLTSRLQPEGARALNPRSQQAPRHLQSPIQASQKAMAELGKGEFKAAARAVERPMRETGLGRFFLARMFCGQRNTATLDVFPQITQWLHA